MCDREGDVLARSRDREPARGDRPPLGHLEVRGPAAGDPGGGRGGSLRTRRPARGARGSPEGRLPDAGQGSRLVREGTAGAPGHVPEGRAGPALIHLDTSFLIRALLPGSQEDAALRGWLRRGVPVAASAIAWTELLCGPLSGTQAGLARIVVGKVLPFSDDDASLAAFLFNATGRRRGSLVDCMIAAVAIRARAEIATANASDFDRFAEHGLRLATA
ncbi:MAG: type II toxin-antitoxin system VapC family toxin [Acidobacteria bacterium]|nr:MAG: type II toxin-antitoxin system VapC family toxin [Acidobacteriota bacterium]MCE7958715.1 type II toxin-antitoxin system VapC family toxin [Acidobacteria bacterium ACB2]